MAKIIEDNTISSFSKRVITSSGKHKFLVEQNGYTNDKNYDIFHCDDCTLNNKKFELNKKGNIKGALAECENLEYHYENKDPFGEHQ